MRGNVNKRRYPGCLHRNAARCSRLGHEEHIIHSGPYFSESFRPFPCTVQDSKDVYGLSPDMVSDDIRLRGDHELMGTLYSPTPAHLGEGGKAGDAVCDSVVRALGGHGVVLQQRINDGEELPPCPLGPLDGHEWESRA